MTRTDPPDILVSTVFQDITASPAPGDSQTYQPFRECKEHMSNTVEDNQQHFNKRHCRSFDFLESLDEPQALGSSMEYPSRRNDGHGVNIDSSWNEEGRQNQLRLSSKDHYSSRQQHHGGESGREKSKADQKKRARSKSAPRVKNTFTPVPIDVSSPPPVRRGREVLCATREPPKRVDASPRRDGSHASMKAMMNEVHPIKLQPQKTTSTHYSPLYVSDCFDMNQATKTVPTPHVRSRIDIKPDESVLQHTTHNQRASISKVEVPYWPRQPGSVSLSLPYSNQVSVSRTPTPTDSYSGDHMVIYPINSHIPNEYYGADHNDFAYHTVPSPREIREYPSRERRALSSPNVPTEFFFTEDHSGFSSPSIPLKATCYEEHFHSVQGQSIPSQIFYGDDRLRSHAPNIPPRVFYKDATRTYPIREGHSRSFYGEDVYNYPPKNVTYRTYHGQEHRPYPLQNLSPRSFYADEYGRYLDHSAPSRMYFHPRVSQPLQFSEWHSPDSITIPHPSARFSVPQSRRDSLLSPWYSHYGVEQSRLGIDTRHYSRSWDNILTPVTPRDEVVSRGRSCDNLLSRERRAFSPDERRQPVVVNLSSSPKRYAALSLSENSILEKMHSDRKKKTFGRSWFVTPEITITDNDIKSGGLNKAENRSASWDVLDSGNVRSPADERPYNLSTTKESLLNGSTLQRSIEQLDELIADLVIDYKAPAGRRASDGDNLVDQLKKLINENDSEPPNNPAPRKEVISPDEGKPMKQQPGPSLFSPDGYSLMISSDSGFQKSTEECSPDLSTDEDDMMMCSNVKCGRTETMFNACLYFKSCHSCYTYYCSRNCRREDWDVHKENCVYGRIESSCRHLLKFCRDNTEIHKAFSRIAKVGFLSRGRGVLFLGFPNPGSAQNFLQFGLESLLMSPTYLSLRELEGYSDKLGNYCKGLQEAGNQYDPDECFLLNVSVAVGKKVPENPSPKFQVPTVRKYAKVALASSSPEKMLKTEKDMETLILTPPPGTSDIDKEGEEGRKAREICFINIQRELRIRGVFLRHEYPKIYEQLCDFVEKNKRFTPTCIYPIDKRTGKQFMCMIMAASEPRTLDWVASPNLLDDIM
ncbi:apical junction component 1 homolog [Protopterus annectens]|uniref:apical junction component 1 homolog n=1 Tax=Protopterus annectens TaxID=7888 RepID=UPI001CFBEB7C|nr:apical junction component 1 homolog [Protopterus annectens]